MFEDTHNIRNGYDRITDVIYEHQFVGTVEILVHADSQRQRSGFVACILHLVYMPVRPEQGSVAYSDISPDFLHFLCIPQRECIVVAVGDEDTLLSH